MAAKPTHSGNGYTVGARSSVGRAHTNGVCAKFIGEKPAGYQPAARCSQNSSQRPLSWEQRRAIIALAWLTVQRIPDCFSRCPMIVLHPKCCRQHFGCNAGNIVTRRDRKSVV